MTVQKRTFDLVFAALGLLLLSPLLGVIALAVKLGDGGPVFFRQTRVGRKGILFRMWKFRTMVEDAEARGGSLTVGRDPRVTPVGRFLRRSKLDELPQLLNVVRGEMSLVGPRPEVPDYVARYTPGQRKVLDLVPGITDPSSLLFRDESALLAQARDPEEAYFGQILPQKLELALEYGRRASVFGDLVIILRTLFLPLRRR